MNKQNMQAWKDWAETTVAAMSRSCESRGRGRDAVELCQIGPVDQSLRCTVCGREDVLVAALLFTMPDDRLAYADGDGLQVFQTLPVTAFQNGVTMVFRCARGHLFFHHFRREGTGTRATSMAVSVSNEAMNDERPLWSPPANRPQKEEAHG
jgi:hypothetical protein